ncbi:lysylphosphatidylglycerol synthase transmembrane domain-containing protein [Candidatus Latescibacterota bacterium]
MEGGIKGIVKGILSVLRRFSTILRLIVFIALFSVLVYKIQPSEILSAVVDARPQFLAIALGIAMVKIAVQVLRWYYLLGTLDPRPSLKDTVVSLFGGFFLGAVTPSRTGELARGMWMTGYSQIRLFSLTVVEKAGNQAVVLIAGLVTLSYILPWPYRLLPVAGAMLLVAAILSVFRWEPFWERQLSRVFSPKTVEQTLTAFIALSPERLLAVLWMSLAVYTCYSLQFYFVLKSVTDITIPLALKTLPIIYSADILLPVSMGDFGVKEAASVTLLGPHGVKGGAALSAAVMQNVLSLVIPGIIGGVIIARLRRRNGLPALPSDGRDIPLSDR